MSYLLAVDIGSTTTRAAAWRDGAPVVLRLGDGSDSVPSMLYRRPVDGSFVAGDAAAAAAADDPSGVAVGFKRHLADSMFVGSATLTGEELTGRMVGWVIGVATERYGSAPGRLLLTAPASWARARRDLLRQAGSLAGAVEVTVLTDAAAAANHYAWTTPLDPGAAVAVYDLGGGGFDAAVLVRTSTGFELCAEPVGDDHTGGAAFDRAMLDLISAEIGSDASDPESSRLLAVAARVKEALSAQDSVALSSWIPGAEPTARLTRAGFEQAIRGELAATVDQLRSTLRRAEIDPAMLSAVLLTGGSSRIPLVAELMRSKLGVSAQVVDRPEQGVCLGAAIAGGAAPPALRSAGTTSREAPDTATAALDAPLKPAATHWARPRQVPDDPTLVVRLDEDLDRRNGRRLLLRLLLLALAAAALVTAAVLLADLRR